MSNTYCYLRLAGPGRDSAALKALLTEEVLGAWRQAGITVWGIWEGLFGVASNELVVIAAAAGEQPVEAFTAVFAGSAVGVEEALPLAATVRPSGTTPCQRPGLYVFRSFTVNNADVEEIAGLSAKAWETFENTDDYQAEPQGLFRQLDLSGEGGRMLLVTWYDGLRSWEISRRPAPEAMENFQRRRELTFGTSAIATRLLTPFPD